MRRARAWVVVALLVLGCGDDGGDGEDGGGDEDGGADDASVDGPAEAGGPIPSLSPSAHEFGPAPIGCGRATPAQFTVSNPGASPVGPLATATDTAEFPIVADACAGATLSPGARCTVEVTFTPKTVGVRMGRLTIRSPHSVAAASLTGTGISDASVSLLPGFHDFGAVGIGATAQATFRFRNPGGTPVKAAARTTGPPFAIVADACSGATVSPNGACEFTVQFAPTQAGVTTGAVSLATEGPCGVSATAALAGTGVRPAQLSLTPTSADLLPNYPGCRFSAPTTFTVMNTGEVETGPLAISTSASDDNQLLIEQDRCAGTKLRAGQSCTFDVASLVRRMMAASGVVVARAMPGGESRASIRVPAISYDVASLSRSTADFGSVALGDTSAEVTFDFTNGGPGEFTMGRVQILGGDAGHFAIASSTCGPVVPSKASCTVGVVFKPSSTGTKSAALSGSWLGCGATTLSAQLNGVATP